jgi:ABC-type branched-subunit amino acid transport system substrate-binding protein
MRKTAAALACLTVFATAACGGGSGSGSSGNTISLGVLTSLSGANSAAFVAAPQGVDARLAAYKEDGGKCASKTFKVVKADDLSSAQGALSGSQKLVQQDKVFSVLEVSSFFYGAAPFMTTAGKSTPVIGAGFDGAKQWDDTKNNLIPASAVPNYSKTYATQGEYFKSVGGTKLAGVAYNNPSAQAGLDSSTRSAQAAGLKLGYINKSVPFGSTDVGAIVLGIINSHADVVSLTINPDTGIAVVAGLRQAGYKTKAILMATGYGADLLQSAPAVQAAQDVSFSVGWAPIEVKTAGGARLSKALQDHEGYQAGIPSFSQTLGWMEADLFLTGLDKAGCDASPAKVLSTIRADKTWTADGLYATPRDFTTTAADKLCLYFLRLKGKAFVPEANAVPLCGGTV